MVARWAASMAVWTAAHWAHWWVALMAAQMAAKWELHSVAQMVPLTAVQTAEQTAQ